MKLLKYSQQKIDENDIEEVAAVLRSEYLTQGPTVEVFEANIAQYCGAKYSISTSNATAALHVTCLALGLSDGDYLWTTPISFVASANCALYCKAKVDFVDIDYNTRNIDVGKLEEKLIDARLSNSLPKILVVVHFAGFPSKLSEIRKLSEEFGFKIIEDASHALGSVYRHSNIGASSYSDATIFSFHAVKNITTGEGGAVTTNCSALKNKLKMLRSHGITREKSLMSQKTHPSWYYEQLELGFNYRLTDFQAALGIAQLKKLDDFISHKRKLTYVYRQRLQADGVILPPTETQYAKTAWHIFVVNFEQFSDEKQKINFFEKLKGEGVLLNVHYIPIHLQPYYQKFGFKEGQYPEAERFYKTAFTLPLHPSLEQRDVEYVSEKLLQHI